MRDKIKSALHDTLGDALDCTRVWDAWSVGTMSEDDFVEVRDDEDRMNELAQAIIDALPGMVAPLVWDGVADDCFMSCDLSTHSYDLIVVDTLERSSDYSWGATYVQQGRRDKNIETPPQATLDEAKAAANDHHVAHIMAAFTVGGA